MEAKTPTRADYMARKCTHEEFYRAVNSTARLSRFPGRDILPRVRQALAGGDEHLNTIPLATWDALAESCRLSIAGALKEHGDFWSMAGGVCCLKQLARDCAVKQGASS